MERLTRALRVPGLWLGRVRRALVAALVSALRHDCLNLAQSAAYSAMVSLFPALIVGAAGVAMLPDVAPLRADVGEFFARVLPDEVVPLVTGYFTGKTQHTARALAIAAVVSLLGASNVIATLIEGVIRAQGLPADCWTFLQRRGRALLLVPLSLLPLLLATMLVMFGQFLAGGVAEYLPAGARGGVLGTALAARWVLALAGVAGVTALIYHLGTPARQRWTRTIPGAVMATAMWFGATLAFGWYVTRFANYSQVYGSLGAGIALLFWLYIVFLSVLAGAEFNVQWRGRMVRE